MATGRQYVWSLSYDNGTSTWTRSFSERVRGFGFGPLQERLKAVRKKKVQGELMAYGSVLYVALTVCVQMILL